MVYQAGRSLSHLSCSHAGQGAQQGDISKLLEVVDHYATAIVSTIEDLYCGTHATEVSIICNLGSACDKLRH